MTRGSCGRIPGRGRECASPDARATFTDPGRVKAEHPLGVGDRVVYRAVVTGPVAFPEGSAVVASGASALVEWDLRVITRRTVDGRPIRRLVARRTLPSVAVRSRGVERRLSGI